MGNADRYIEAATRENTRRRDRSTIRHFEAEWGGFLPASADAVARYLADHAQSLSVSPLRARLAALRNGTRRKVFPSHLRSWLCL